MCIATVYVDDAGQLEKVMQDVVSVEFEDHGMLLTTILGEEKLLKGKIKNIDFLKHSVTVESS
ncbi:MAG: CooT family nickel-binding protein [Dehalococcoidia bacterium]|nr:CooT family nickel-binding protein [Dehalococcoidia bacterium]MCK4723941.1 CooT family nickel-binding protein [Dehalococcoidia bacterium]